jgi:hypothetical protein
MPRTALMRLLPLEIEGHLDRVAFKLVGMVFDDQPYHLGKIEGRLRLPLFSGQIVEGRHTLLQGLELGFKRLQRAGIGFSFELSQQPHRMADGTVQFMKDELRHQADAGEMNEFLAFIGGFLDSVVRLAD